MIPNPGNLHQHSCGHYWHLQQVYSANDNFILISSESSFSKAMELGCKIRGQVVKLTYIQPQHPGR